MNIKFKRIKISDENKHILVSNFIRGKIIRNKEKICVLSKPFILKKSLLLDIEDYFYYIRFIDQSFHIQIELIKDNDLNNIIAHCNFNIKVKNKKNQMISCDLINDDDVVGKIHMIISFEQPECSNSIKLLDKGFYGKKEFYNTDNITDWLNINRNHIEVISMIKIDKRYDLYYRKIK